nr:hypothetical protein [Brucella intermedia]
MGEMIVAHDISHGLKANQQIWADGLRRRLTFDDRQDQINELLAILADVLDRAE